MAAGRPSGPLRQRCSGCVGSQRIPCPYAGAGRRATPFDPAMLVKVVVYGYANGVVARVARKLREVVAFRVLAAGNFPAHRTIRELRQVHREGAGGVVCAGGEAGARVGLAEVGPGRYRRHQAQGERKQAQGDELWTHTTRGGQAEGRDRRVAATDRSDRSKGRPAIRHRPHR